MAQYKLHKFSSEDELETQTISEAVFRPAEINRLDKSGPFDIRADIASIQSTTLWKSSSRSGYRARYGCPKHRQLELHFIEKGKFEFQAADEQIEALPRSAVLLKDTRKVALLASPGSSKLSMVIQVDQVAPHFNSSRDNVGPGLASFLSHIQVDALGVGMIHQLATHLLHSADAEALPEDAIRTPALIHDALMMMFVGFWPKANSVAEAPAALPRHLERAIDWLQHHAEEDVSIEQLARLSGASIRSLQNSFRHYLSTTPNTYILQLRLARVHDELLHGAGNDSIEKIASRWGFGHMGYFAARYRELYGRSPSATRRDKPQPK
ncbi:AraC family transcriptional regulator [Agrobacterium albertimagni AOL15]|uniref:AraC family transcriptional regulator n=1 Tax=Agrobacterium albertimagni AOL15 TaxID=1156935 RepID=K2QCH8_9HYPH|nr:AraC family transcriptional regulator [Agrobacterium albertimagni]EKF61649.1 AraC family transcriptional regulator [Agrobacterium albertimagni AOL15]